jgi:hypothetical protein
MFISDEPQNKLYPQFLSKKFTKISSNKKDGM